MRNFNYINCSEPDTFRSIRDSKNLIDRRRLTRITPSVNADYNQYINHFTNIHQIGQSSYSKVAAKSLRRCYSSSTQALSTLKANITKAQSIEFQNTCPYCLLRTISTYDHYIPQQEYPVYCVMAKNLIPCCGHCNSVKNENWRRNGHRIFIHFLNDPIPTIQFLFGTLVFNNNVPTIQFSLLPNVGIPNDTFELFERHFSALNLLPTYTLAVSKVVSDIKVDVSSLKITFGNSLTTENIKQFLLSKSHELANIYGTNYWKTISLDLLANSSVFLASL